MVFALYFVLPFSLPTNQWNQRGNLRRRWAYQRHYKKSMPCNSTPRDYISLAQNAILEGNRWEFQAVDVGESDLSSLDSEQNVVRINKDPQFPNPQRGAWGGRHIARHECKIWKQILVWSKVQLAGKATAFVVSRPPMEVTHRGESHLRDEKRFAKIL